MLSKKTLQRIHDMLQLTGMKKTTTSASRHGKTTASTTLRAYRFDTKLFGRFEVDCDRHLRNPRTVLEALIFHWLHADASQRDAIAEQYQKVGRTSSKLPK